MPWRSVLPMEEKIRFIGDYLNGIFTFSELCDRYGISRKTGYKWVDRYVESGVDGLKDRSRRPKHSPRKIPEYIEKAVLKVRSKHPLWGASKILKILSRKGYGCDLPARSTVCEILRRNGCIKPKRRNRRRAHPGRPLTVAMEPTSAERNGPRKDKNNFL